MWRQLDEACAAEGRPGSVSIRRTAAMGASGYLGFRRRKFSLGLSDCWGAPLLPSPGSGC